MAKHRAYSHGPTVGYNSHRDRAISYQHRDDPPNPLPEHASHRGSNRRSTYAPHNPANPLQPRDRKPPHSPGSM